MAALRAALHKQDGEPIAADPDGLRRRAVTRHT
jgi:hypothetical protein